MRHVDEQLLDEFRLPGRCDGSLLSRLLLCLRQLPLHRVQLPLHGIDLTLHLFFVSVGRDDRELRCCKRRTEK